MLKGFSINLTETRIALSIKTAVAIAVTIALFGQDLSILFTDAVQSEVTSHLLAIPFLFAYLIYRKRKMLRAVISLENKNQPKETRHLPLIAGILLSIIAISLYWYGSYTFTPIEYHMLALPIFASGILLILFNLQTLRQLVFPTAFLIFLIPPPSEILYNLGSALSVISSEASNAIVNAFGIQTTITSEYNNPTIIVTRPDGSAMPFTVDIACSGIYSLIGFTIFAVFIAYVTRDKLWKKLALIAIGLPLIYLLNIIRITIILTLGYHFGEELALQMFHLLGGWVLIFLGTFILLAISEKILKTPIFTTTSNRCGQCNPQKQLNETVCSKCGRIIKPQKMAVNKADILKIAAIAIVVIMLISVQAPVFALTQGPAIVTIGEDVFAEILPPMSGYTLHYIDRLMEFELKAKQDLSLLYLYAPINQEKDPIQATIEIASTRSSLHRWETCLITWPISKGYQPKVTQIELKDVQLIQNPPIISRYFVFNRTDTNLIQAVIYWYETATFKVDSTYQQKHAKISLIAETDDMEDLPKIESQLINIATATANYWQPIKTWSTITMIISQNGAHITLATVIILIATIFFYVFKTRKQKKASVEAYQKLSLLNKQIADAVLLTQKTTTPTLNAIAETYKKTTRERKSREELLKKLSELENIDIIKSYVYSEQDEPFQTWKSQILYKE